MLGDRIREIRIAKRMSQVELAHIIGVTKQSISNWENENIQPSIEMLSRVADALSVSVDFLLDKKEGRYLNVTGLPEATVQHLQALVTALRQTEEDA